MSTPAGVVGVISDTHGLLREAALEALSGSGLIIHAGDIGKPGILERLQTIAPVVAVKGNVDKGGWASRLPKTAVAERASSLIYVLHDIQELDLDPVVAGFHIVISGHSHKPSRVDRDGVTYLNPGSAGPRRFDLPITLARIDFARVPWKIVFIDLSQAKPRAVKS